jgi:antitoxin VapB
MCLFILPNAINFFTSSLDKVDTLVYTIIEVIILETAKLFTSGGSQAVRLPKSCRFDCAEVAVKRIGNTVMLFQKDKVLENLFNSDPITDDVYEAILEARRDDAEYTAKHDNRVAFE